GDEWPRSSDGKPPDDDPDHGPTLDPLLPMPVHRSPLSTSVETYIGNRGQTQPGHDGRGLWGHFAEDQTSRRASLRSPNSLAGVTGISRMVIPNPASASSTALAMAAEGAMAPLSPTPLMPRSLTIEGEFTSAVSSGGSWAAVGNP